MQKSNGINLEGATDLAKLDYIEFALATFILRYEGLWASQALRQVNLCESRDLPRLDKLSAKLSLLVDFRHI